LLIRNARWKEQFYHDVETENTPPPKKKNQLRLNKLAASFASKKVILSKANPNTKQQYPFMRGKR
jgi:hypothetical protein